MSVASVSGRSSAMEGFVSCPRSQIGQCFVEQEQLSPHCGFDHMPFLLPPFRCPSSFIVDFREAWDTKIRSAALHSWGQFVLHSQLLRTIC